MARLDMTFFFFVEIGKDGFGRGWCLADLVYVHVALSAASGLEHDEGEVVGELSGDDLGVCEREKKGEGEDVRRLRLSGWRHQFWDRGHS